MATQPEPDIAGSEDEAPERGPLRRCLVKRESFTREAMLRFVAGPQRQLVFDVSATLPGRGLWLSASRDVIDTALKRGVFARVAKQQLVVAPDLAAQVETALIQRIFDLAGLARRSGAAIAGFEKAREWLTSGKAGLVLQAVDGSVEERARFVGGREVPVVAVFSAARLGKIFGREQAVHVVIAPGRLAKMIEIEAGRLAGVAGGVLSGQ
ncbi:RNA-binding protein [Acidocella sp.]|uniref:RNA-binding protein n=1 Tax=Acidocella sp. TaxID=50710 RepID=UPI002631B96B|nr:RNA-binding protein [Acidocella sp.]MDD2795901.1 RNA-binding protein [Acidocella sp.]